MKIVSLFVLFFLSLSVKADNDVGFYGPFDIPSVPSYVMDNANNPLFSLDVEFRSVSISKMIDIYYDGASGSYSICSDVLKDERTVSIRASLDFYSFSSILKSNGYDIEVIDGIAFICTNKEEEESAKGYKGNAFVYTPKYQDVESLINSVRLFVDGVFSAGESDHIIFSGDDAAISRLELLLSKLDQPSPSVVVRAVLYEVSSESKNLSALKILGSILSGKVNFEVGGAVLNNSLSITRSSFEAVASVISEDSRFSVITNPYVRVRNNKTARLQVGADVPVSGQILINPNGQATQQTDYLSSGVIFDVTARIKRDIIDLDLTQTVSSFVNTTTGNSNPTLNKREINTSLSLSDGEIVVLGGLVDSHKDKAKSGFFGLNFSKSKSSKDNELVLLLHVEKV